MSIIISSPCHRWRLSATVALITHSVRLFLALITHSVRLFHGVAVIYPPYSAGFACEFSDESDIWESPSVFILFPIIFFEWLLCYFGMLYYFP
jgi:hypothetical protein